MLAGVGFDATVERLASGIEASDVWWLVVLRRTPHGHLESLALVIPEDLPRGGEPQAYLTTIDVVEAATGYDLLAGLPDAAETRLEAQMSVWWPTPRYSEPCTMAVASPQAAGAGEAQGGGAQGLATLNRAEVTELLAVRGVGPMLAGRLVAARPFASWSAVDAVAGIGPATLAALQTAFGADE